MAIDLSALEDDGNENEIDSTKVSQLERELEEVKSSTGKPLELLLSDIEEDPNQPRQEFDKKEMEELAASIKERGVKQPVSVRTHPDKHDKWMLNFGARRYRASIIAGKKAIPAFIDNTSEDFDQVIENDQRENLKPMELALFIAKKLKDGLKKNEIAKKLGRGLSTITDHLALINAPDCIEKIYREGKCASAKTLYELRRLHEKYPEKVEQWCKGQLEVTRRSVDDLKKELAGKPNKKTESEPEPEIDSIGSTETSTEQSIELDIAEEENLEQLEDPKELTSWPRGKAISDPDSMKKPLLLVNYEGRSAAILLNRKPSSPGLIKIRYEDGGGDDEVDAGKCRINLLTESEKN